MNYFKSLKKRGNALYVIVILIIIIAILGFLIVKFGLGDGDGKGNGTIVGPVNKPPITQSPVPTQPPTPPQPPIPQNPSKLILEWRDPDNFSEIETKINNQLKPEIRTVIVRTEVMKITTAKEDKLNELIKNKGSEAELKIEQFK